MPVGVIIDCLCIVACALAGAKVKDKVPQRISQPLNTVFGICAIAIGVISLTKLSSLPAVILSLISRSFFADSSYMLSFSVLCSCVCSRLISPSVSSWHKQDNTLMHQSPGHIQRRTPYNF